MLTDILRMLIISRLVGEKIGCIMDCRTNHIK